MQRDRVCYRCSKSVVGLFVSCSKCTKEFHPGCVKAYLSMKSASECCLARLPTAPSQPVDAHAPRVGGRKNDISSPLAEGIPPPGAQSLTTDAMLQSILTRIDELDKRFADRLDRSDKSFSAAFERSDKKISGFIARQEAVNVDFANKLSQLPDVIKLVSSHGDRIAALEARSSVLLGSQGVDVALTAASRVPRTSDIIVSGIPHSLALTADELVTGVFHALGVPRLISDVLETRDVAGRGVSVSPGGASGSCPAVEQDPPANRARSIIVALKSREIRDHIIRAARGKRRLAVSDVFPGGFSGSIYINELLPTQTYNLLRRARVKARQLSYKHVWTRDGRIFVRKAQGEPPISIDSEADLVELQ